VQNLNIQHAASSTPSSSYTSKVFAYIFPSQSPAVNALLATLYISGPPNFLLALCPPNIDPSSLSIMVAFAVGGILGDTLFHLLPEIFLGEDAEGGVRFVMVEGNRNLLLGVAILVGFMTFVALDKSLRIATGGSGGHDHSHTHSPSDGTPSAKTTGAETSTSTAKSRKPKSSKDTPVVQKADPSANPSIRLSAYLNLIADFTHNITDGLAMSSSFYASPTTGAITTMAVFFHEIPHEVGDFALLIQSGFSKKAAMLSQFITALGALLGTGIGIAVQEYGGSSSGSSTARGAGGIAKAGYGGLWGTSLQWGDLLLPFTAGTFLYVGTVAVIPEMLETGPDKQREFAKMVKEFMAIAAGAGIMLA
jgi:zinc transporter 7